MIALPQGVLEQAIEESRAGHFVEAWTLAGTAEVALERAQARTFVRYHAGDLEGALREAREGLQLAARDPWLLATATEIALSLHRGAAAEATLASWSPGASATDAPAIERATRELGDLRAAERGAARGVSRGRWTCALAGALALAFLLRCTRRAD